MKFDLKPNDLVKVRSKTGEYIAKFIEQRNEQSAVVETLAVLKHPTQGDLHNPNQADVPLFHQRKAHAFHEKVLVNMSSMSPYEGEVPDYTTSLRQAITEKMEPLQDREDLWAKKSYEHLEELYKEYFE